MWPRGSLKCLIWQTHPQTSWEILLRKWAFQREGHNGGVLLNEEVVVSSAQYPAWYKSTSLRMALLSQQSKDLAMGQKRVPQKPIGKRKPKPAVPSGVLFDPQPQKPQKPAIQQATESLHHANHVWRQPPQAIPLTAAVSKGQKQQNCLAQWTYHPVSVIILYLKYLLILNISSKKLRRKCPFLQPILLVTGWNRMKRSETNQQTEDRLLSRANRDPWICSRTLRKSNLRFKKTKRP